MAYMRGKYGVEYTPQPVTRRESHFPRWFLIGLLVLVTVSFFVARSRRKPRPPVVVPQPPVVAQPVEPPSAPAPLDAPVKKETEKKKPLPQPASPPPVRQAPVREPHDSPFSSKVDGWIASRAWPKSEQELLIILRDSERQGNVTGARAAIEKLMYHPPVEDLKDQLVRRLGELNTQLLFSGTNTPWTATVTVKRGDTLQRIASEHRTTLEALQKLNPLKDPNRLALGQKLRVLNFPDADLIVHKQLQFAELLLKKRIFKRYYVTVRKDAESGAYPVTNEMGSRASDRLRALLQQIAPVDRDELRIFLAPGSRITVTAQ